MQTEHYFGKDLEAMSFAENYHHWILDEFRPYLNGVAAEVGAGSGNFTRLLTQTALEHITAFEPSENMYRFLAERFEGNPKVTALNSYFMNSEAVYRNHFDAVVYVNVLEHVERDFDELVYVRQSLKPGGALCVFVPALQWLYSDLDRQVGHHRRYHKPQLETLVREAGFRIEKINYFDMLGIIPWYLAFVMLGRTITGSNVSAYDKWIVPAVRRLESLVAPPIGKNLLLVAKKPAQG